MIDYFEWLTAGRVFLLILGTHDANGAALETGIVRGETTAQCTFLPPPPSAGQDARIGFAGGQPAQVRRIGNDRICRRVIEIIDCNCA